MQECRFTTPSQDAGIIVLSMGDGILTHLSFKSPDPTSARWRRQGTEPEKRVAKAGMANEWSDCS
jgi:hypothetical protein